MRFSFYKENKVIIDKLIESWNENFTLREYIKFVSGILKIEHFVEVVRNKNIYTFQITEDEASYIIWFLDLKTLIICDKICFGRLFFRKNDYNKLKYGLNKITQPFTYNERYGPDNQKFKEKYHNKIKLIEDNKKGL